MSDTETARLLALVRGEPVGEPCTQWHPHGSYHPDVCFGGCNGTGRINTEPVGEVERAVAEARAKLDWAMRELDLATRALEAERAAHQATRFELISISGAEDWESAMGWVIVMNTSHTAMQKAHEETKRQLAEEKANHCESVRVFTGERDTALREKAEAERRYVDAQDGYSRALSGWIGFRDAMKDRPHTDDSGGLAHLPGTLPRAIAAPDDSEMVLACKVCAMFQYDPPPAPPIAGYIDMQAAMALHDSEQRLATAEQRATEAEATVASLACMLGWMNTPPRDTLERSVSALNHRVKEAEALAQHLAELEAGAECMHNRAAVAAAEAARDAALADVKATEVRLTEERIALYEARAHIDTLREALLGAAEREGCWCDWPGKHDAACLAAQKALATTPTAGLMEKVRGLCAASERACVDLACQRDDVSCFEVNAQPRCEMCAVSEALTALYDIAPGVKP